MIEGVYVVPCDSPITTAAEVDRDGVRIGVKQGSAYDLFLSRTLQHATVVRGDEGVDVFRELGLEVAAGIRQPMTAFVGGDPGIPPDRAALHADPAGDGHHEDAESGDRSVPVARSSRR